MRKVLNLLIYYILLEGLFFSRFVFADTQLVFNGMIKQSTCEFTVDDVILPTVDISEFTGIGTILGGKEFLILLQRCKLASIAEVKMTGKAESSDQNYFANIARDASGVAIKVSTNDERQELQKPSGNSVEWKVNGATAILKYMAEYVQTAPQVLPGVVKSVAQVNITYR